MDSKWIELLDSPQAADREKAVKAMAQSGDEGYIQYLNAVARTDADDRIRSLAEKAIRYLERQNQMVPSTPEKPIGSARDLYRNKPEPVEVSVANQRRATEMLNRALTLSTRHEDEAARELVVKAYRLNPNIRLDGYERGIVGTVMGVGANEAFDILDEMDGGDEKAKRKAKNDDDVTEHVGWGTALFDLTIYAMVVAVTIIVSYFLIVQVARPALVEFAESVAINQAELGGDFTMSEFDPATLSQALDLVLGASTVVMVINAGLAGVFTAVGTLIVSFFVHIAASMLGGTGSMPRLINKTVPIYSVYYVITLVYSFVGGWLFLDYFAAMINASDFVTTGPGAYELAFESNMLMLQSPGLQIWYGIGSIMGLVFWIIVCGRIAAAYDFSWLRGCFSQFLAGIFMSIAMCGCIFVFSTVLGTTIASIMSSM